MRTVRMSLAGAVTLSLLGGLGVAAIAQSDDAAPAEPAFERAIMPISGTMTVASQDDAGDRETYDWGLAYMDEVWTTRFDVGDARLDGLHRSRHNRFVFPGTPYGSRALTIYTENDGGSWVGTGHAYQDPDTTGLHYQLVMDGQGGYEGLSAIIALDQPSFSGSFEVTGAIIAGGLPPVPAAAPTAIEPAP